jgi:FAD/FMN-containing dehydrogenase
MSARTRYLVMIALGITGLVTEACIRAGQDPDPARMLARADRHDADAATLHRWAARLEAMAYQHELSSLEIHYVYAAPPAPAGADAS